MALPNIYSAFWRAALSAYLAFLIPSIVFSQDIHSTVTGLITDRTGGVLQGARIELDPFGLKTISDTQGSYSFRDLAPGNYTLKVSFVGFADAEQTVALTAGQTARANVVLEVAANSQQILVRDARPHGEAEAINRERTAENILQVLPSEVITSLPNANVADAIGRLPSVTLERDEGEGKYVQIRGAEPRYSNVTIDGVNVASPESVRQIKLDIIPSDLVESVEISKTLLANQDGDAIGGSVNLRTRTAVDQPTLSLYGMGGFTPIFNTRGVDQFGGTVGKRFGRNERLGVLFGGTYDWNGRGINDVEPSPTAIQCEPNTCDPNVVSSSAPFYGTYGGEDIRDYRYYRTRFGFEGSVDYRLSNGSSVYVRGLYSHFDNFGDRWLYSPAINSYTSPLQGGTDGTITSSAEIRRPVQVIGSIVLGGQHNWGANGFKWDASAGRSASEDKGYSDGYFQPTAASDLNNVQYGLNLSNPYRPRFVAQNVSDLYSAGQYALTPTDAYDNSTTYSPQVNLSASGAYSRGYNVDGHLGTFELGGKFRNVHKFQDSNESYYNFIGDESTGLMSNFTGTLTDPNYYDKSYTEGPFVQYSKLQSFFNSNPGLFPVDANQTHLRNDPNNWNLTERISAGYLMNTIEVGKWRLYTGVRFEATNESILGYQTQFDSNENWLSTSPLKRNSDYLNVLPSAELRYTFDNSSDIRFAFGRGIARPDYGDLPPYVNVDDSNHRASIGNPNLRATKSTDYDILYERYLNPVGLIQAGVFFKDITAPIYSITTSVTGVYSSDGTPYQQSQPMNGSSAWLAGFEIAYQQRLSYLPGLMNGLGISANYSYTDSRANGLEALLGRSDHPHLQRQAPHTWNISPTYDKGRLSMRIGLAYNDSNIWSYQYSDGAPLGVKGPLGDTYLATHFQVDAQASIRLNHGLSAVVYGLNLNNEVFGFYNGSPIWPIQREYYQPTYGFGMRWNPVTERF